MIFMAPAKPEPPAPDRLHEYAGLFREDFRRRDQARWVEVYLRGLLGDAERKSIEPLARRIDLPAPVRVDDTAQALQNFINQSPWDEEKLWRRFRRLRAARLAHPDGVFVIEDITFPKQGRHSVGVQRQFSAAFGRKVNCQVVVSLHYLSPLGDFPLAGRLYLPRSWLADPDRLDAAGVPEALRIHLPKWRIALELLDRVRAEGLAGRHVVAGAGYGVSQDFREGLGERGLPCLVGTGEDLLPPEEISRVAKAYARMNAELGLGHFEGRSWRGFHHHLCLVMLAYGFLAEKT